MEEAPQQLELIERYFTEFTTAQKQQLSMLDHAYREWNSRINVISRKDIDSLYEKHVLHSLSIAAVFTFRPGSRIVDIGTGGGFPGIPLAIFFPGTEFLLVDSIGKKLKVVDSVAAALGLQNVRTHHGRVEEIRGHKFDFAVSRAVAPLKELWQWSRPLLRKTNSHPFHNGLICLKGGDLHQEIVESHTKPRLIDLFSLFPEPFFREKFIVYVPAS